MMFDDGHLEMSDLVGCPSWSAAKRLSSCRDPKLASDAVIDIFPGLVGTDCFDVGGNIGWEVPSTRRALLDESSRRKDHSGIEGIEDIEGLEGSEGIGLASFSSLVFFFLRPGIGKENFPWFRTMIDEDRQASFEIIGGLLPTGVRDSG
jgi:hypothetical protein